MMSKGAKIAIAKKEVRLAPRDCKKGRMSLFPQLCR